MANTIIKNIVILINSNMKVASPPYLRDSYPSRFRQSISLLPSQSSRNSIPTTYSPHHLYPQGFSTFFNSRKTMGVEAIDQLRRQIQHRALGKQSRQLQNLELTLGELQKKLASAKKQFTTFQNVLVSDSQYLINSQKVAQNEKTLTLSANSNTSVSSFGNSPASINQNDQKNSKVKEYYLNNLQAAMDGSDSRTLDHLNLSLKVFKNASKFLSSTFADIEDRKVWIPRSKQNIGKKTLVLDIDETLIHCEQDPSKPYDIAVPVEVENGSLANAYITIRPYAISFLKRMSKYFEIIAFTASHQSYADAVLDEIDPQHQYIKYRLYRKNCTMIHDKIFAKDLRIINRDLGSIVLVDNAPYSYLFQLQNGIPILPYFSGQDLELVFLEKYLEQLAKCKDVRQLNKKYFRLHKYAEYDEVEELVKEVYG